MRTLQTKHTLATGLSALFQQTEQRIRDGVRSAATLEMQRAHGRWLELELGADLPLHRIDEERLEALTGPRVPPRRFGPETLRKRMSTLRAVLQLAHRRRWIDRLPAFPQVLAPWRPRRRYLRSYRDAERLFESLPRHRAEWFWLALWTGQHASDVERMRWEDVDLRHRRMLIRNTKNGKRDGLRVVMPEPLRRVLVEMHRRDKPRPEASIVRPWSSRSTTFMRACVRLGLTPINAIDCRHTCFSWAVRRKGITPAVVAWAGHSSPSMMARTYAHALPAQLAEVAAELESMVDEPPEEEPGDDNDGGADPNT